LFQLFVKKNLLPDLIFDGLLYLISFYIIFIGFCCNISLDYSCFDGADIDIPKLFDGFRFCLHRLDVPDNLQKLLLCFRRRRHATASKLQRNAGGVFLDQSGQARDVASGNVGVVLFEKVEVDVEEFDKELQVRDIGGRTGVGQLEGSLEAFEGTLWIGIHDGGAIVFQHVKEVGAAGHHLALFGLLRHLGGKLGDRHDQCLIIILSQGSAGHECPDHGHDARALDSNILQRLLFIGGKGQSE
jgi:hypothetical protein